MKYLLMLLILSIAISISTSVMAADGDIDTGVGEVQQDIVSWKLIMVELNALDKFAKIIYRKIGADTNPTEKLAVILFQNDVDNPETPADETSTEFTDLIVAINNGSNIKNTITAAVKIKLGI